jgi:hypothetical protein
MHLSQIDPRLFNPTSSELAGALTLPPLDSPSDSQNAYISPPVQADDVATSSTTVRSSGQSRYCSVKGCRNVIGGDYLYKMCVPCRNRYRGYGMTKRSKSKRGREIAAQELQRRRAEEDTRRAQQGLPVSDFLWLDAPPHSSVLSAYWRAPSPRPSGLGEEDPGDHPPPASGAIRADIHPSRSYVYGVTLPYHTARALSIPSLRATSLAK